MRGEIDSASYYLNRDHQANPSPNQYYLLAYLAQQKGDRKQTEVYADSILLYNQTIISEFKDMPIEYGARLGMGSAYALKGEKKKALEQIDLVRKKIGNSFLSHYWSEYVQELSSTYAVLGQKAEAVQMLQFLVKNNYSSPAFIKIHPLYKNLAGYPPFEELIKKGI